MAPAGSETSARNSDLNDDLVFWNRRTKLGIVFDSSGALNFLMVAIALLMRHGF